MMYVCIFEIKCHAVILIPAWCATSPLWKSESICIYQSEVHDGFGHQLPQETEFHLDFGDVRWFGGSAERHCKQPPGTEHVLGGLLASCRSKGMGSVRGEARVGSEAWVGSEERRG